MKLHLQTRERENILTIWQFDNKTKQKQTTNKKRFTICSYFESHMSTGKAADRDKTLTALN